MKLPVWMLLLVAVLSSSFATAQEVAGRLVVAIGDVTIDRGGQKIAAQRGTEVRVGDTVQLGATSNAQLLFTDDSVIALRPETQFRISEYSFQNKDPDTGRAVFNLLKGGLRTVTGLIGKRNRENYSVGTPVATIGIRGTHYNLVHCDSNCRNPNGSLAPNGTYGGVSDGRISVKNQAGESQFGHDQYFHVASLNTAAQPLIAPPGFLRDKLEGRSRSGKQVAGAGGQQQSQQQGQGQQQAQGQQQESTVAPTSDTSVAGSTSTSVPTAALTTNTFQVTNTTGTGGITTLLQPSFTGTIFYRVGGTLNIVPTTCGTPPCSNATFGEIILGINYAAGRATVGVNLQFAGGDIINFATPASSGGVPITISGSQVTFSGTANLADFPLSQGAFRCARCGINNTPGFATQLSFSGTINGAQATLNLSAVDAGGGGSLTVTLPQATPPNTSAAAMALPNFGAGTGTDSRSNAYWNVLLDGSGRLLDFGPLVGAVKANLGTAVNTIVGSAPTAGNLVWGTWGAGAQLTDFNYVTYTSTTTLGWITGDATNSIPASLGTQTYTVIPNAWIVNGGTGTLNSGSLTADFVNRTVNLSLNATNTVHGNTYQMNGAGAFNPTTSRFSQGFNSVTCSGPCSTGTPSGGFGGFFAGSQAQGAGVAFNAGYGVSGLGVSGVVGMKR